VAAGTAEDVGGVDGNYFPSPNRASNLQTEP
jgi:hypothetical protein